MTKMIPDCEANKQPLEQRCHRLLTTVGDALYVVGGKWTLRIIIALSDGEKRFNELQRSIGQISARVLSNELKQLELNGFIRRSVQAESIPVMVTYVLTDYSFTLSGVVQSLSDWGAMHRQTIQKGLHE